MKTSLVFLGFVLVCWIGVRVEGAPSLAVSKPPVQSPVLLTGPPVDPSAVRGQWFRDQQGVESVRTNEFYDEPGPEGFGPVAIYGYVDSIQFAAPGSPPAPMVGFTIQATVLNDTYPEPVTSLGNNSHGESLSLQEEIPYVGTLVDTKMAVEFALTDLQNLPALFQPPYRDRQVYIVATNEDQAAWYCWNPQAGQPVVGHYFVPTWDFGSIPVGQTASRQLGFSIPAGLSPMDARYPVILASFTSTNDVLMNRTTSLKISTWIDEIGQDPGKGQPGELPLRHSDVSVFHNPGSEPMALDFGDAPDPTYPTLLANDGARHVIVPGVQLGLLIDPEADGQPSANADGDDLAALADEDGIVFSGPLVPGQTVTILVTASISGYISGWIDYAGDGSWAQAGDQVLNMSFVPGAGKYGYGITVPPQAQLGPTYARFRFTTLQAMIGYTGLVSNGEVEDYRVVLEESVLRDFGDAMDSPLMAGYPTLLINNGARHDLVPGVFLGARVDAEPDGQPTLNADGDDLNPALDDEDGVTLPSVLVAGSVVQVSVVASVPGYLNAWMDWNANGTWGDPLEQVFINTPLSAGPTMLMLPVPVPPALVAGGPHSRWRFTTNAVPLPTFAGALNNGEVEDYEVRLEVLDFGDAPDPSFPTLLANDGARHRIPSMYWLGAQPPDLDPDGQPTAQASGDDAAGSADEDGVQPAGTLIRGSNITFRVVASTNGFLNAWMDWNGNQSWVDAGEQIAVGQAMIPGTNHVTVTVPAGATVGQVIGRFRFSNTRTLLVTGLAGDGEVEDHRFVVYQDGPAVDIVITNLARGSRMTVQWNGQSSVIYEAQFSTNHMAATNLAWVPFSGWISGAPYEQLDTNGIEALRFYRVVAPYSPPP